MLWLQANSFLLILHRGSITLFIYLSLTCRIKVLLTRCDSYEASRRMEGPVTNCNIYVSIHNYACLVAQGRAGYFTRTRFSGCWKFANILIRDVFSYLLWGEMLKTCVPTYLIAKRSFHLIGIKMCRSLVLLKSSVSHEDHEAKDISP